MNRILCLIFSFLICASVIQPAFALNGMRVIGFSARDAAMGGATTASSEDASCMVKNPAGLVELEDSYEFFSTTYLPRTSMYANGVLARSERQKSTESYVAIGGMATNITFNPNQDNEFSFGLGLFPIAGVSSEYHQSRISPYLGVDTYDRSIEFKHLRLAPTLAKRLNEKLSLGLALNLGLSYYRTDLPTNVFAKTEGNNHYDEAFGAGFTLGLMYKLNDSFNLGVAYESPTWMEGFDDYQDVAPQINIPQVASIGLAYKVSDKLELTHDTRWIDWDQFPTLGKKPADGGFGWREQFVFAFGLEYALAETLDLRMGYNYGKSPIRNDVVFANALSPLIIEDHASLGLSKQFNNWTVDLTYEHYFKTSRVDNGKGDAYSQGGKGTYVNAASEVITVGFKYKY